MNRIQEWDVIFKYEQKKIQRNVHILIRQNRTQKIHLVCKNKLFS